MTNRTRDVNLTLNIGLHVSGLPFEFSGSPCCVFVVLMCGVWRWMLALIVLVTVRHTDDDFDDDDDNDDDEDDDDDGDDHGGDTGITIQ